MGYELKLIIGQEWPFDDTIGGLLTHHEGQLKKERS